MDIVEVFGQRISYIDSDNLPIRLTLHYTGYQSVSPYSTLQFTSLHQSTQHYTGLQPVSPYLTLYLL